MFYFSKMQSTRNLVDFYFLIFLPMNFLNMPVWPEMNLSYLWIDTNAAREFWQVIDLILKKRATDKESINGKTITDEKASKPADTLWFSIAMALRIAIAQQIMITTDDQKIAKKSAMKWWKDLKIAKIHRAKTKSVKKSLNKPITPEELKSWMEYELSKIRKRRTRELTEKILMGQNISLVWFAEEDRLKNHLEGLLLINTSSPTPPGSSL